MAPEGVADTLSRVRRQITGAAAEYWRAVDNREDRWVVAGCGGETPFLYEGTPFLYVFNPALGQHAYANLLTDMIHDDYRTERS